MRLAASVRRELALQIEVNAACYLTIALRINLMNISAVTIFLARVVCTKRRACQERVGKDCTTKLCAYPRLTRVVCGYVCREGGSCIRVCWGGGGVHAFVCACVNFLLSSIFVPAIKCGTLPPLQNGNITYSTKPSKETVGLNVQAFYSCKTGFTLEGDKNVTCGGPSVPGGAGKWSGGLNSTCVG